MQTQALKLNPFQESLLAVPEAFDVFLGGGRGGGKSYGIAYLALRHAEQYGQKARILYLRKTYKGLADFELVTRELFGEVYGSGASYNATEHVWRLPNGGYFELGQLESYSDYQKYQGRSFTLVVVDEAQMYASPSLLDMIRSNLRGSKAVPVRFVIAANPGGVGHQWLAQRYVFKSSPWKPFAEEKSKRTFVYCPSTFAGNNLIDTEQYRDQLQASCPDDPELLRAWTDGDWTVARGAYFSSSLEESRNAVEPWDSIPEGWRTHLAHDFGSAAPSVTFLCATSPGEEVQGRWYSRDSIVLVDEYATAMPSDWSKGLNWTAQQTGEAIAAWARGWGVRASGVADDAIFANVGSSAGSIAEELRKAGVSFDRARKADRITGWQRMRRMLSNAGKPDVPGLYISRRCEGFWATVPYLARDVKRVEDLDTTGADHWADACRYGLLKQHWATSLNVTWAS